MSDVFLTNMDYIRIKNMNTVSYGGNQAWCKSKKMQNVGCGVIALADISIYLAEQNPNMMTEAIRRISKPNGLYNKNDYLEYVRFFQSHFVIYLFIKGMNGWSMQHALNRYFMLNDIGLKAKWKVFLSDEEMMKEIRHLIRKNKPVVLSIGPNTPNIWGNEGIPFYVNKDGKLRTSLKRDVKAHFVVVTGVTEIYGQEYLIVSSWGKQYYINYEEYREYISKYGGKLTSSILYIKGII
ncbi:MAG: hypothetical protein ACI4EF_04925 [Coprococcus sp.]